MDYVHYKCGGAIENNQCSRCHKRWSFFGKWFATDIRLAKVQSKPVIKKGATDYAKWADKLPGVGSFASRLPKIPRIARILVTIVVICGLLSLVMWLAGVFRG